MNTNNEFFSKQELSQYQREPPTIWDSDSMRDITTTPQMEINEGSIPLTEERLDVSKKSQQDQATITKKPVKETKTEQIPIMYEELVIEEDQLLIIHHPWHLIIIFQQEMRMKN